MRWRLAVKLVELAVTELPLGYEEAQGAIGELVQIRATSNARRTGSDERNERSLERRFAQAGWQQRN